MGIETKVLQTPKGSIQKWGVGIEPTNTRVAAERVNHFAIPTYDAAAAYVISPKLELKEFIIPVYISTWHIHALERPRLDVLHSAKLNAPDRI